MTGKQLVEQGEEEARFNKARLPWHPAIEEKFGELGVTKASWKALTEAVYPAAKTADSVVMALSYCAARKLDPFKRPVHIVPMWDSQQSRYVETVWPGISEIRTTAFRTGQYAGCDEMEFGPLLTRTFKGMVGKRNEEREITVDVTFPEWGRATVYRTLNGQRCKFVGPRVFWLESYAKIGRADVPNDMWQKRPHGQLEKCVEAAALRKAFPEEIGNDYSAEEMSGQVLAIETPAPERVIAPPPPAEVREAISGPQAPPAQEAEEAEFTETTSDKPLQEKPAPAGEPAKLQEPAKAAGAPAPEAKPAGETFNVTAFLEEVETVFASCRTASDVDEAHEGFTDRVEGYLSRPQRERYGDLHAAALERVGETTTGPSGATAPPPADDDDDAPAPEPSPAEVYAGKLRAALQNCTSAAEPGEIWNASRDERKRMEQGGEMTTEFRKKLHNEVLDVYHRLVAEQGRPEPASGNPTTSTTKDEPAGGSEQDTELARFTDEFRTRIEAVPDTNALNALITETQEKRDELKAKHGPAADAFKVMIAAKRKKFAGI